ncbi:MAG: hypothetical protein AAGB46_14085 [Verrucomicrobiota bacterium]
MENEAGHFDDLVEALQDPLGVRSLCFEGDEWVREDLVLSEAVGSLENLEVLEIEAYGEVRLPESLRELKKLRKLSLDCGLREVPWVVWEMEGLEELELMLTRWELPGDLRWLKRLRSLDVQGVTRLCPEIGYLKRMERLNVYATGMRSLPVEIQNLTGLKGLDISYGAFPNLPKFVCRMSHLEYLNISYTFIDELPLEIANLKGLRTLEFGKQREHHDKEKYKSRVLQIRQAWCELRELRKLDLSGQRILDCSANVRNWTQLEELDLSYNEMDAIPGELFQLGSLRKVDLNFNRVQEIPEKIGNWERVEELSLNGNPIEALPEGIGKMKRLRYLDLRNTRVSEIVVEGIRERFPRAKVER